MKKMIHTKNKTGIIVMLNLAGMLLLGGCTVLQPAKSTSMSTYALEAQFDNAGISAGDQTLLVTTPGARPGFDSRHMVYTKKPHELEFFTQNQWVESPAHMLAPLLVQVLESSGKYRAVVTTRSAASADLRLDTEIIRLQHEFITRPSQVHLTVRAQLIDMQGKRVLATQEFDVTEAATSDDPYGGVIATNRAVKTMLIKIAEFCALESKAGKTRKVQE